MHESKETKTEKKISHFKLDDNKEYVYFSCPHCNGGILVLKSEIACKIFRHGTYSKGPLTGHPIGPHESKENIDKMIKDQSIYGCGKPFQISYDLKSVSECGYI